MNSQSVSQKLLNERPPGTTVKVRLRDINWNDLVDDSGPPSIRVRNIRWPLDARKREIVRSGNPPVETGRIFLPRHRVVAIMEHVKLLNEFSNNIYSIYKKPTDVVLVLRDSVVEGTFTDQGIHYPMWVVFRTSDKTATGVDLGLGLIRAIVTLSDAVTMSGSMDAPQDYHPVAEILEKVKHSIDLKHSSTSPIFSVKEKSKQTETQKGKGHFATVIVKDTTTLGVSFDFGSMHPVAFASDHASYKIDLGASKTNLAIAVSDKASQSEKQQGKAISPVAISQDNVTFGTSIAFSRTFPIFSALDKIAESIATGSSSYPLFAVNATDKAVSEIATGSGTSEPIFSTQDKSIEAVSTGVGNTKPRVSATDKTTESVATGASTENIIVSISEKATLGTDQGSASSYVIPTGFVNEFNVWRFGVPVIIGGDGEFATWSISGAPLANAPSFGDIVDRPLIAVSEKVSSIVTTGPGALS